MKRLPLPDFPNQMVDGVRQVSQRSDEVFLLALSTMSTGIDRAAEGVAQIGRRVSLKRLATRLGLRVEKSTEERIRTLLVEEAKRRPIEVSPKEFEEFAEKMGLLFELIFSGVIRIEDIALEGDESAELVEVAAGPVGT